MFCTQHTYSSALKSTLLCAGRRGPVVQRLLYTVGQLMRGVAGLDGDIGGFIEKNMASAVGDIEDVSGKESLTRVDAVGEYWS